MQSIEAIQALVEKRVGEERRSPGLVVGVLTDAGRAVVTAGVRRAGSTEPVARDTLFEIGSITKVFTALLLADASLRGELSLDAPINDFLPPHAQAPDVEGQPIRLVDLATHSSGLPSFMDGAPPFDDGWGDAYGREALLADVHAFKPTRAIGAAFRYSNTGYGLLGIALEAATGRGYEALLRERVLDPLGMTSTAITLTPALDARAATPHGAALTPVKRIGIPCMASAGALWSDVDDLMTFAAAIAGMVETPLRPAFDRMLTVRRAGPPPLPNGLQAKQAIGWPVFDIGGHLFLGHAGGTVGMGTMLLVCPETHEAVVALGNSAASPGNLAAGVFNPERMIDEPPSPAPLTAIARDPALEARLVGRYAFAPGVECLVEMDETGLICRPPDAPRLRLVPHAPLKFFNPAQYIQASFDVPPEGPATSLSIGAASMPMSTAARVA
jgi:serine-type D-Ala-D-Ala carboxypeptidase/endopeptidase